MGALDAIFQDLAVTLVGAVRDMETVFTRTTRTYDPLLDTDTEVATTLSLKVAPPTVYDTERVDQKNVIAGDVEIIVPAKPVDAASFDLTPGTSAEVTVAIDGTDWRVISVEKIRGGDEVAVYIVQARQ